jgi:glutamine---fructose-6-phosphate transaminase (isomerizing)
MCGIVGHIGKKKSHQVLKEGLSRLEYRGYDSAGMCLSNFKSKKHETYKAVGKLKNLISEIKDKNLDFNMGISHTRWATHGSVNIENCHPHENEHFAIVHNGIVENYPELKEMLSNEGFEFKSETDTEVYLNLLTKTFLDNKNYEQAIVDSFKLIDGNSVFLILSKKENIIWAIRRNSPLVIGTDAKENLYVSSDPYALIGFANEIYFPEDEVLCKLENKNDVFEHSFLEMNLTQSSRFEKKGQSLLNQLSDKGDYEHYMLKEIHEQPKLIRSFINYYTNGDGQNSIRQFCEIINRKRFEMIHIIGCGTAYHAGLVIKHYIENHLGIPCVVELASEFRYREPLLKENHASIFISQSGETADTLAAQKLCKEKKLYTIGIINTYGSSLYRDCDLNLLINAGPEIGVASTKAFTLQVLTGYIMSILCKNKDYKSNSIDVNKSLTQLADSIQYLISNEENKIKVIAEKLYNLKGFIFTGRGRSFPGALEGALKLKEIAYVHAEGYAAGELKHGPIAMIDEKMCNICILGNNLFEKMLSNIQEVKARHGVIFVIGSEDKLQRKQLEGVFDYFIECKINKIDDLDCLVTNVVNQLFSYYLAKFKGTDIDQPRNLAKSVTVE